MKRLCIATAALCLILCGCASDDSIPPDSESLSFREQVIQKMEENEKMLFGTSTERVQNLELVSICDYTYFKYFRELRTDVMYIYRYGNGPTISVMLHPDGTPLLYSEWLEMEVLHG